MRLATGLMWFTTGCTPSASDHTAAGDGSPTDTDGGPTDTDGGEDTDAPDTDPPACLTNFQIGTGATQFTAVADGDPLQIVYGSQGGWHIDAAGLVTGFGDSVSVTAALFDDALGVQLAGLNQDPGAFTLTDYDGCGGTFFGTRTVIDDYLPATGTLLAYICAIGGRELRLEVAVEPLLPTTGAPPAPSVRTVTVTAVGDPTFEAYFCAD